MKVSPTPVRRLLRLRLGGDNYEMGRRVGPGRRLRCRATVVNIITSHLGRRWCPGGLARFCPVPGFCPALGPAAPAALAPVRVSEDFKSTSRLPVAAVTVVSVIVL